MKNTTFISSLIKVSDTDLQEFTPLLYGWSAFIFNTTILVLSIIAVLVQSAVFLTLRKMGSRHINVIIRPCLVRLVVIVVFKQTYVNLCKLQTDMN